jgi:predicted amidohydrolase YtcJ
MGVLGGAQKISRQEALRVEAYNNAYLTYEENIKGSIEPGKLADFLVLSDDLLTVPEEEILSIKPLATYVGGKKVFSGAEGIF